MFPTLWNLPYLSSTCVFFVSLGAFLAIHGYDLAIMRSVPKRFQIASIIFSGLCFIVHVVYGLPAVQALGILIGIPALWWICIWLGHNIKPYSFFGFSFMIYALHSNILEAIEKLILIFGGRSTQMAAFDYFVAPVITVAIIIGLCMALRYLMPKTYGIVSGGR
jgi:hypothetical protein